MKLKFFVVNIWSCCAVFCYFVVAETAEEAKLLALEEARAKDGYLASNAVEEVEVVELPTAPTTKGARKISGYIE